MLLRRKQRNLCNEDALKAGNGVPFEKSFLERSLCLCLKQNVCFVSTYAITRHFQWFAAVYTCCVLILLTRFRSA